VSARKIGQVVEWNFIPHRSSRIKNPSCATISPKLELWQNLSVTKKTHHGGLKLPDALI
jgi:hypothetical protein